MNKIIVPNQHKIDETEEIVMPMVKCNFCGNQTTTGMHQIRLEMVEKGIIKVINGKKMYKPAVMKQIHYYMCPDCIAKGTKWPGQRP
jgi:uncharacterized protein YifN (PemK superfamily)